MLPLQSPELVGQVIKQRQSKCTGSHGNGGRPIRGYWRPHQPTLFSCPTTSRGVILPSCPFSSPPFQQPPPRGAPEAVLPFSIPEIFYPPVVARGRLLRASPTPSERHRVGGPFTDAQLF
ncbi:hypothetical protein GGI42DRAFT_316668 [Trichoderma sp. SZMC 28013]